MLDSVEEVYHSQSARLLQLRLASSKCHSVMTLSFFEHDDFDFALEMPIRTWSNERREQWEKTAATRIRARCADLLEVKPRSDVDPSLQVYCLHRTIRDFIEQEDVQELLEQRSNFRLSSEEYFCASFLAQLKISDPNEYAYFDELLDALLDRVKLVETQNESSSTLILDKLNAIVANKRRNMEVPQFRFDSKYSPYPWIPRSVCPEIYFAMKRCLDKYIQHRFKTGGESSMPRRDRVEIIDLLMGRCGRLWGDKAMLFY